MFWGTWLNFPMYTGGQWINGQLTWTDGRTTAYTNWMNGQPSGNNGCVMMSLNATNPSQCGRWYIDSCSGANPGQYVSA